MVLRRVLVSGPITALAAVSPRTWNHKEPLSHTSVKVTNTADKIGKDKILRISILCNPYDLLLDCHPRGAMV